jgi:hypothetical protein
MALPYDHSVKAGNRGDVVKHAALIAGLASTLEEWDGEEFLFADTFAGYAHSYLRPGLEWEEGVGELRKFHLTQKRPVLRSPFVKQWFDWYVAPRPQLGFGIYPGSTVIALDVGASLGTRVRVAAWDISPSCVASLMNTLGTERHAIHAHEAQPQEEDVRTAQFLFVDPPKQTWFWPRVRNRFLPLGIPNVLVWLPLKGRTTPPATNPPAGFSSTVVRWGSEKRSTQAPPIGCQLIYRFHRPAACQGLRKAVHEVASLWIPNWRVKHYRRC